MKVIKTLYWILLAILMLTACLMCCCILILIYCIIDMYASEGLGFLSVVDVVVLYLLWMLGCGGILIAQHLAWHSDHFIAKIYKRYKA